MRPVAEALREARAAMAEAAGWAAVQAAMAIVVEQREAQVVKVASVAREEEADSHSSRLAALSDRRDIGEAHG